MAWSHPAHPPAARTAHTDHRPDRQRFRRRPAALQEAGMNDFVAKPIDPSHLFEKIFHWLSQGR
jgi:CheY-like chemotaxis protein